MDRKTLTLFALCFSLLLLPSGCSTPGGGAGNVTADDIREAKFVEDGLRVTSEVDGKYFVTPGRGMTTVTFTEPDVPENPDDLRNSIGLMRKMIAENLGAANPNKIRFVFPQATVEE